MRFAIYTSRRSTIIIKVLRRLIEKFPHLLNTIDFVLIDNTTNDTLRAICADASIELIEVNLSEVERSERNLYISNFFLDLLVKRDIDYTLINCNKILEGRLFEFYRDRIFNFHPSLLPNFKGMKSIDRAIEDKAFLLGNTAHVVVEELDSGPIVMQSLLHSANYEDYDDVLDMQIPMFIQLMQWLEEERLLVSDGRVFIKDGDYSVGRYMPALEIEE